MGWKWVRRALRRDLPDRSGLGRGLVRAALGTVIAILVIRASAATAPVQSTGAPTEGAPRGGKSRKVRTGRRAAVGATAVAVTAVVLVLSALALVGTGKAAYANLATCAPASGATPAVSTNCLFGGFEIDGNTVADGGGLDWQSSPAVFGSTAYTPFYDLFNSTSDNIMSNGSKESDQSTWSCVTQKSPGKDDLGAGYYATQFPGSQFNNVNGQAWAGAIWFQTFGGDQYIFGALQRFKTDGDVHLDFEFNRDKAGTLTCGTGSAATTLPVRESGDVLLTFDTGSGGATIFVSAFSWSCPTTTDPTLDPKTCTGPGSFTTAGNLTQGGTFAGQANTATQTDTNIPAGAFGEAGLNLSKTIGSFSCGEFGSAFEKDRTAGTSDIANGNAEVKDFVAPVPFNPGLCPVSSVTKAQADETTQLNGAADESPETATEETLTYNQDCAATTPAASAGCAQNASTTPMSANPGDEIVYQVTYHNTGGGATANHAAVVQDTIPTGTTYVGSSQSCPTNAICVPASSSTYNSAAPCSSTAAGAGQAVTNLVWCLPSEAAGANVPLYFEVDLPSTSSASGTTTFGNFATVSDTGTTSSDTGGPSNFVAAQVAFSPVSALAKKEADVQPSNQYCDTASGGAVTSNTVCNSLLGTLNANPSFISGPINAAPGDIIEYQLTYSNNGDAPATNVVISDTVPTNSTYVAGSAAGAGSPTVTCFNASVSVSCTSTSATVTSITWKYSSVTNGGSEAVMFEVKAAATFPGSTSNLCLPQNQTGPEFTASQIGNCASVVSDQDSASSGHVIANVAGQGALVLSKSASVSGSTITYTISYFNVGDQSLTGQSVSDLIPTNLKFVSCSGGTNANTGTSGSPNTCGGTAGQGGTVMWTVNAAAGTTATNPAGTLTLVVSQ